MKLIHTVQAVSYNLGTGPGINPTRNGSATLTLERLLSVAIGVISIIAFLWFTFQIIFAGYNYISAQGDPKKAESARKTITDGVLGLIIVIVAITLADLFGRLLGISNVLGIDAFLTSLGL